MPARNEENRDAATELFAALGLDVSQARDRHRSAEALVWLIEQQPVLEETLEWAAERKRQAGRRRDGMVAAWAAIGTAVLGMLGSWAARYLP